MNPRFKPLLTNPAAPESSSATFSLKVVSSEQKDVTFKPLSSVLPAVGRGAGNGAGEVEEDEGATSKLDVKREGDKVTRLNLTCNCGRMHEIDLDY